MRIGFLAERLLVGFGVDLVIDQVATRLSSAGNDVTVYAANVEEGARTGTYAVERLPVAPDRLYPRYEFRARRWAPYLDAQDLDVVFIETFPFFSLIPVLATPTVAVDHGISSTEGMSLPRRAMFSYVSRMQYRHYLPRASALVTVSEFLRNSFPREIGSRTRVIPNGADHYPTTPERREAARAALGIGPEEIAALYVGRLNPDRQPYKGTADLLRFAPQWRTKGIRLVMAGRGEETDARLIRAAGGVAVLGPPPGRMPDLYAAADIFVTASRWEGFDLPLAEAHHAGLPSVALDIGAHREVAAPGETAILAGDAARLAEGVELLAGDPVLRRTMGEEAGRRARDRFRWDDAATAYEDVARSAGRVRTDARRVGSAATDVTAIVLNYGAEYDVLERCLGSLARQSRPVETILVDNGSARNRDALDALQHTFPGVRQLRLDKNYGFSGGINRGIAEVRTPYVFVLNNDTEVAGNAVEEMHRVLATAETDIVGVAPKLVFDDDPEVFDAVGNLVTATGVAFNMGIGQIDIGQYDRVERTFGACFAAALIRTGAFATGRVGPLDESFFMYYEDIDWCFRANVLGYGFLTAPGAVVRHRHSYTSRLLDYSFKYRLIERNFIRTVLKNFERGHAVRAATRRSLVQLRNAVRGIYPKHSLLVILETLVGLPRLLRARAAIQGRRRAPDDAVTGFSRGERSCYDATRYAPERSLTTIEAMYRRKYLVTGDERYREIASAAADLQRHRADPPLIQERLQALLKDEPARVQQLAREIAS